MRPSSSVPLAILVFTSVTAAAGSQTAITQSDCTVERLGLTIDPSAIGLPVSAVKLNTPEWKTTYCSVTGSIAPIDPAARPIQFGVALPAQWSGRAAHFGGGGMNGRIPALDWLNLLGSQGFATYGSDSGHQMSDNPTWTLNEESIANLGYAQLKKTHDAAMVIIARAYQVKPRLNYFFGTSQGGREGLTVAQRFPADYDGISSHVPIVNFSSLMLAPELIRIQEKKLANWVTPAKVDTIRNEFLRQCDSLDGLADGIIQNYNACRAIFDVKQGKPGRKPWSAVRCPGNKDAPTCLTDGQIATLEMVYTRYVFAHPLANGVRSFGMWLPNTDPSGSGLIAATRFRGQEGAAETAPVHGHLGVLGVTGFLMKDLAANPLDYVEGGKWDQRRIALSAILDSTNPDLSAFRKRGGKLIVVIGTNDTLASPGAQLDYYQSVLHKMGRPAVDKFARFYVLPQTGHGLTGKAAGPEGKSIPSAYDRAGLLIDWVENGKAPGKSTPVTAGDRSLPMCSYPDYPKYISGPPTTAASYQCSER